MQVVVKYSTERHPVVQSVSIVKDHYKPYRDFKRAVTLPDRPVQGNRTASRSYLRAMITADEKMGLVVDFSGDPRYHKHDIPQLDSY
jgi:hypothetical protein